MSLPEPAKRRLSHTRRITLQGYTREDGLYDIEAELIDVKDYGFPSKARGFIEKDEPLHHMQVRVTISEEMEVQDAVAVTIAGPYHICPQGALNIRNLIGAKIQPGWKRIVQKAIGGSEGCTHITELMGPVATVAFQTIYGERAKQAREAGTDNNTAQETQSASLLNSCYALTEGREGAIENGTGGG